MLTVSSIYKKLKPQHLGKFLNYWPPYLGAGIGIRHIADDWSSVEVRMKLRWFNRNYVGTHYGGNLFSMADPFYMIMLMKILGRDYLVWDKSARIDFLRPGKGEVKAIFTLAPEEIEQIKQQVATNGRHYFEKAIEIIDRHDDVVARVTKVISIRPKTPANKSR
jgi:acyl-coenzyme A thioesterase PaaI-like protein